METKKTIGKNLENKRFIFLELGFIVALVLVLFAFEKKFEHPNVKELVYPAEVVEMDEFLPVFVPQRQSPPPKVKFINPLDVFELTDEPLDLSSTLEINDFTKGDSNAKNFPTQPFTWGDGENEYDPDSTFIVVEEMPRFKGDLNKWLSKHLRYPHEAEIADISGRVFVQFVVEKDGSISGAEVINHIDPSLTKEAIRVVNDMPKWDPGRQRDKPVRVKFTLPIVFKLQ